jgi:hypothetical protein
MHALRKSPDWSDLSLRRVCVALILACVPLSPSRAAQDGAGPCGISSRTYSFASNFANSLPNIGAVPGAGLGFTNTNDFLSYFLKQLPADPILDQLRREFEAAWRNQPKIGVTVTTIATAEGSRAVVQDKPSPDSPAGKAGIESGDIITAVGDNLAKSSMDVVESISNAPPGSSIALHILRGGQNLTLDVPVKGEGDFGRVKNRIRQCLPMSERPMSLIVERRARALEDAVAEKQKNVQREETERRNLEFAQRPDTILGNAYIQYIRIRRCHKERQGYLSIFISDEELADARRAVMRLEQRFRDQIGIDGQTGKPWTTESMWAKADQIVAGDREPYREACQAQLRALLSAYRQHFPSDFQTPKDF